MKTDLLEDNFLGRNIKVAVRHLYKPGELFFHYGILSEVTDGDIVLFSDKKMLRLERDEIMEIHVLEDKEC